MICREQLQVMTCDTSRSHDAHWFSNNVKSRYKYKVKSSTYASLKLSPKSACLLTRLTASTSAS